MNKLLILLISTLLFGEYFYSNGNKINLELTSISRDNIKYYKLSNGEKIGVNNQILVKFKIDTNVSNYIKEFNLKIIKQYRNNLYLFQTPINKEFNISNSLYNSNKVIYAYPNFIHSIHRR